MKVSGLGWRDVFDIRGRQSGLRSRDGTSERLRLALARSGQRELLLVVVLLFRAVSVWYLRKGACGLRFLPPFLGTRIFLSPILKPSEIAMLLSHSDTEMLCMPAAHGFPFNGSSPRVKLGSPLG